MPFPRTAQMVADSTIAQLGLQMTIGPIASTDDRAEVVLHCLDSTEKVGTLTIRFEDGVAVDGRLTGQTRLEINYLRFERSEYGFMAAPISMSAEWLELLSDADRLRHIRAEAAHIQAIQPPAPAC